MGIRIKRVGFADVPLDTDCSIQKPDLVIYLFFAVYSKNMWYTDPQKQEASCFGIAVHTPPLLDTGMPQISLPNLKCPCLLWI